jgi:hypothetical protein
MINEAEIADWVSETALAAIKLHVSFIDSEEWNEIALLFGKGSESPLKPKRLEKWWKMVSQQEEHKISAYIDILMFLPRYKKIFKNLREQEHRESLLELKKLLPKVICRFRENTDINCNSEWLVIIDEFKEYLKATSSKGKLHKETAELLYMTGSPHLSLDYAYSAKEEFHKNFLHEFLGNYLHGNTDFSSVVARVLTYGHIKLFNAPFYIVTSDIIEHLCKRDYPPNSVSSNYAKFTSKNNEVKKTEIALPYERYCSNRID